MIELLFEILILKSIGITSLLLVILLVRPWILKWSNARVAYGLWLMLPVYLLLPINFVEVTATGGMMTFFLGSEYIVAPFVDKGFMEGSYIALVSLSLWLVGVVCMLALFTIKYKKLKQSLFVFDNNLLSDDIKNHNHTNIDNLQLVGSTLIDVPAVFGLFKSYLILPKGFAQLPTQNQKMILNHELYHIARHDHRINFLRVFIKNLFWFNPIFYWADKFCEADQEISCDLGVLQNSKSDNRLMYAKVLLESVTGNNQNKLVSQWKYKSLIKERVKMLKNISSKKWHSWVAVVFAASAIWVTSGVVVAEVEEVTASEAVPTIIVQPRYPRKAAEEGIEGWVKFRFNVDSFGHPYEVALIDAKPRRVFERDARRAIYEWRFDTNKGQENLIYTMEFMLAPRKDENPEDIRANAIIDKNGNVKKIK